MKKEHGTDYALLFAIFIYNKVLLQNNNFVNKQKFRIIRM